MKIGIIGCGNHAQHHARTYGKYFTTYVVWDLEPSAMELIPSVKKAQTLEALLDDPGVEAVMICSPDKNHLDQTKKAIAAGKHVFCEKPLLVPGEDINLLEAVLDLAATKRLVISTCHPRRYDKPFRWLKDGLPGLIEKLGPPVNFNFDFSYHKPTSAWKHGRSLLLDHLNHEVDLMNYLFGIQGFEAWKLNDSFDQYDVVGRRDDGITFNMNGTRRLVADAFPEWCRVRFDQGEVIIDMMMGDAHILSHETGRTELVPKLGIDYEGRLDGVMHDFFSQIRDRTPGYISRSEMLMNTEAGIVLQNNGLQKISIRP